MTVDVPIPRLVVIGGSWGGLRAAVTLLREVPAPIAVPVLLVLHRARTSERVVLERVVSRDAGHPAEEVDDKHVLRAGTVHIAPPDYHVLVEGDSVSLSVEDPVNYSRPSLDLVFDSAAREHRDRLVAVLLSGLGNDGVTGLQAVRARGGRVLVQEPHEAERGALPEAAIAAGLACEVGSAAGLGKRLAVLLEGGRA